MNIIFERTCEICGKKFIGNPTDVYRGMAKYCSHKCQGEALKKRIKCICQECGEEFEVSPWRIKRGGGKFCSNRCQYNYRSKHRTEEKAARWKGGPTKQNCTECGREFKIDKYRLKKDGDKFCSVKCMGDYYSKHYTGENAPQWKGGLSFKQYCPKFSKEFKERVRGFFSCTCQLCGEPQGDEKLHVHHVNYEKDACCDPNVPRLFIPLCRKCHNKTNHNRKHWDRYFTELITSTYNGKCYFTQEEYAVLRRI